MKKSYPSGIVNNIPLGTVLSIWKEYQLNNDSIQTICNKHKLMLNTFQRTKLLERATLYLADIMLSNSEAKQVLFPDKELIATERCSYKEFYMPVECEVVGRAVR